MDGRPVGIFDSGVGGLTVVKAVKAQLPDERIVYFGDTARMPYGAKTAETVTVYAKQIINFLLTKDVKAVIIACGTVSSNSYDELTSAFDIPLIEMVGAGAAAALAATKNGRIGVLATEATIASNAHKRRITAIEPAAQVYGKACPLFVPLIEEGWTDNAVAQAVADIYVKDVARMGVDALLLGCTHYPLLAGCIGRSAGEAAAVVDPAVEAAAELARVLDTRDMRRVGGPPMHEMFVSDNPAKFRRICGIVTGQEEDAGMMRLDG